MSFSTSEISIPRNSKLNVFEAVFASAPCAGAEETSGAGPFVDNKGGGAVERDTTGRGTEASNGAEIPWDTSTPALARTIVHSESVISGLGSIPRPLRI